MAYIYVFVKKFLQEMNAILGDIFQSKENVKTFRWSFDSNNIHVIPLLWQLWSTWIPN